MIRRLSVAASLAALGGLIWLSAVTLVRIVDWIVGGTPLGWATLIGGMVLLFVFIVIADAATDGKVVGDD